jgi:thiamine-monophosphate kinase
MPSDPNEASDAGGAGGEEALIAEFWAPLAAGFPGAFNLADDCAVIAPPEGCDLVVTTDALISGVHFFADEDADAVGWKALAVNVSDLVAKGAVPLAYVMSVALPALDRPWLTAFAAGLSAAQEAFGCRLVGGDTDRTPGPLTVSITAFGSVPAGGMLRRATARPGDRVYVAGTIGDAALGLALRRDPTLSARCRLDEAARRHLAGKFSRPQPPLALVPALRACASAAIDISDGLMKDLRHLCRASGVGARIVAADVPLSEAARAMLDAGGAAMDGLLTGGEDYTVLAAVPAERGDEFQSLAAEAGTRVTCIGTLTAAAGETVALDADGAPMRFAKMGWDHFSPP